MNGEESRWVKTLLRKSVTLNIILFGLLVLSQIISSISSPLAFPVVGEVPQAHVSSSGKPTELSHGLRQVISDASSEEKNEATVDTISFNPLGRKDQEGSIPRENKEVNHTGKRVAAKNGQLKRAERIGSIEVVNFPNSSLHNQETEGTEIRVNFTRPVMFRHYPRWKEVAPVMDSEILIWIQDYVDFHNDAIESLNNRSKQCNDFHYLIFTCNNETRSCSGTGNRQRGISGAFLVALLTKRILLIDVSKPVPLDRILEPNLIQWNAYVDYLNEHQRGPIAQFRNRATAALDSPSDFSIGRGRQYYRFIANGPQNLDVLLRTKEMTRHLEKYGTTYHHAFLAARRWIFITLFRPSLALVASTRRLREQLGLHVQSNYVAVHLRMGNEGDEERNYRYSENKLGRFVDLGNKMRRSILSSTAISAEEHREEDVPIVVFSDLNQVKEILYRHDPSHVRYVNSTIVHVDRTHDNTNNLDASLSVWADLLVLVQSTCLVKSHSSFSGLAHFLSKDEMGARCFEKQSDGMLPYTNSVAMGMAGKNGGMSDVLLTMAQAVPRSVR